MYTTLHQKGLALAKKGNYQEAINYYTQTIEAGNQHPDVFNDRAVAYFHINDKLSAFNDFTTSKNLQPDYGYRYACLGFIKDAMGDIDGAIEDYQHAIKLDPEDAVAMNNLGLLQEKKGYQQAASVNFQKADKLSKELSFLQDKQAEEQQAGKKLHINPADHHNKSLWSFIKEVFTKPSTTKEFFRFIRKGFKL